MFFIASKVAGFFLVPSNMVAMLCGVGLLLLATQFRRAGLRIAGAGIVLFLVLGYSPLASIMMLPLTERFPAWQADGRTPDGIIVLGSAIDPEITLARGMLEMGSSAETITTMLELARQYPAARIVFSGGSPNLISQPLAEAPLAGELLQRFGVSRDRILLEPESRTTSENARFTRRIVHPKTGELWLLVTSAFHMPRAVGAFRKEGFDVEAYPVDWRMRGWIEAQVPFHSASAGLARTDNAVHEWIGLAGYWLTGRTRAFFPAPK